MLLARAIGAKVFRSHRVRFFTLRRRRARAPFTRNPGTWICGCYNGRTSDPIGGREGGGDRKDFGSERWRRDARVVSIKTINKTQTSAFSVCTCAQVSTTPTYT